MYQDDTLLCRPCGTQDVIGMWAGL